MKDPDAFSPEVSDFTSSVQPSAFGEKRRSIDMGSTMRRLLAAGAARYCRPKLRAVNLSGPNVGVGSLVWQSSSACGRGCITMLDNGWFY